MFTENSIGGCMASGGKKCFPQTDKGGKSVKRHNRSKETDRLDKPITVLYMIDTCILTPDGLSLRGGAEKQLYLLASSLDPEIFKPIVIQLSPANSLPVAAGNMGAVNLLHFPTRSFYSLQGLYQLIRICRLARRERVKIIHTFFEKSEVMGWLTARLSDIPVWITSRRDLGFNRKKIFKQIFRFTAPDCDRCVAVCHAVKDRVVQQERLAQEKIEVIYNGLDFSMYQHSSNGNALRNELGVDDNVQLVGMIANFNFEIKGHRYFMEAAKSVLKKVPDVEFLLIGDGPLRHQYEEMARSLGVDKKVHFLGSRSDVPIILPVLSASVLSSTSEGLSNVILESMAAGRPVVATRVGGNPELVIDGTTGYLAPPADHQTMAEAIISLLKDQDKATAMGAAGRKLVEEKFTVESMVKSYEHLYKSLTE